MSKKTQTFENVLIAFTHIEGNEGEDAVILDCAGIPQKWLDGIVCYDNNFEYLPEGKTGEVYRCLVESWESGISGISDFDRGFHILKTEKIFDPKENQVFQIFVQYQDEWKRLIQIEADTGEEAMKAARQICNDMFKILFGENEAYLKYVNLEYELVEEEPTNA